MIWILYVLLITSVYFSTRFFLLNKNITMVKNQLEEICDNVDSNRRITYYSRNREFEKLLIVVNKYIDKAQKNNIKYIRRENGIRKEIENISHDLRTPLTSILGYLEFLRDKDISEEEKNEYLEIIQRRSNGLYSLVKTFYDISRLEGNDYKLNMENLDINKELKEYILLFYNDFESKGIEVEVNLLNEQVHIEVDKNALQRVFNNLFQNAIKYTKSKFQISLEKLDNRAVIILSNDTDKLDENDVEHIFDRFYMKDDSRQNSSTGLGLTVSKLLIEEMQGEIKAKIEENLLRIIISYEIL